MKRMYVEGVEYHRFRVRYRLTNGKRRSMVHWSPGFPWVRTEVLRRLDERVGIDAIAYNSVTIRVDPV